MKNILYVVIFMVGLSCKTTISKTNQNEIKDMDFKTISKGALFGDGAEGIEESNLVIRNEKEWEALLAKMNSVNNVSDRFQEVPVDFSKEMVICVFDKIRSSGGYHAMIFRIQYINGKTTVAYRIQKPGPKDMVTTVITQPYHLIKIEKREKEIEFVSFE